MTSRAKHLNYRLRADCGKIIVKTCASQEQLWAVKLSGQIEFVVHDDLMLNKAKRCRFNCAPWGTNRCFFQFVIK